MQERYRRRSVLSFAPFSVMFLFDVFSTEHHEVAVLLRVDAASVQNHLQSCARQSHPNLRGKQEGWSTEAVLKT